MRISVVRNIAEPHKVNIDLHQGLIMNGPMKLLMPAAAAMKDLARRNNMWSLQRGMCVNHGTLPWSHKAKKGLCIRTHPAILRWLPVSLVVHLTCRVTFHEQTITIPPYEKRQAIRGAGTPDTRWLSKTSRLFVPTPS